VDDIPDAFEAFWNEERQQAFDTLCEEEQLISDQLSNVVESYLFTGRKPLRDHIVGALKVKPRILDRKTIVERITEKVMGFVETFDEGIG
jgi:type I restriction enzyme R subunit